jgi:hypothetical protein
MLPYVSDITSLLSGLDVERNDMAVLKDLKDAVDGLDSSSKSLYRKIEDLAGESKNISFMTSKAAPVDWPYIFVGRNKSNADGTFAQGTKIALMVYNASDAEEIGWTFNDEEIVPEGDGYFTLEESGILKAIVSWEDGSRDIIEKKINISLAE